MSAVGKVVLLVLVSAGVLALSQMVTAGPDPRGGAAVRVIVHPDNPTTSVDQRFATDAFLKKVTRWPNDIPIRPVDLRPDSAIRQRFSDEVLRRSVAAVKSYWQQMVFSGRQVPPPELDGEDQVVRYVLHNPGGIGYVSGAANIEGAKLVSVR